MTGSLFKIMKTILALLVILSVLEEHHGVLSEDILPSIEKHEEVGVILQRTRREPQRPPHAGALTRDVPKKNVQPGRLTKDLPKYQPQAYRHRREADDTTTPQTRPELPGSAGQPQVQPPRTRRAAQRHPYFGGANSRNRQRQYGRPGGLTRNIPRIQPYRRRRATKDSRQTPPPLPGSAGQPQIQPPRNHRSTGFNSPQTRPVQLGSAGQPQIQPIRPTVRPQQKRYRRDADVEPKNADGSRDIPKELLSNSTAETPIKLYINDSPVLVEH